MAVTTPTGGVDRRTRGADRALVTTTVGAVAAIGGATWWSTRLGGQTASTIVAASGAAVGAVLVAVAGRRSRPRARRAAIAATVVVGVAFVALASSSVLVAAKVRSQIPGWTAEADQLLGRSTEPGFQCESFPVDPPSLAAFGRVDQRCVSAGPGHRQVTFSQRDPMGGWTGLLYQPGATGQPTVWDQCLAHLDGPWWQTASAIPSCPGGFTFMPGG